MTTPHQRSVLQPAAATEGWWLGPGELRERWRLVGLVGRRHQRPRDSAWWRAVTRVGACGPLLLPAFTNGVAVLTAIRIRARWREVTAFAVAVLALLAAMFVLGEVLTLLGVQSTAATAVSMVVCFPLGIRLVSGPVHALGEGRGHAGWVYVANVAAQEHPPGSPGATALMEALLACPQVAARWTFLDALAPNPACQDRLLGFYRGLGYEADPAAAPRRGRRAGGVRMQRPPGPFPTVTAAPREEPAAPLLFPRT